MEEKIQTLRSKLRDVVNLNHAAGLLSWDQQTHMPPGGAEARAEQLATLSKISHQMFTSDEIGQLLEALSGANFDYDSDEAALVRVVRRDYDQARKLPPQLVEEMSRTFSLGQQVWVKARAEKDFSQFQEVLEKIVGLNIQVAEALGYEEEIYDALLDQYEPGMKTSEVAKVFAELKAELVPLVRAIVEHGEPVDDALLQQAYDETAQWDFSMILLQDIGYDLQRGRQDKAPHPFTSNFSINDVRVTTRIHRDLFPSSLFTSLHEGGHALYEQNSDQSLEGSPLAGGTSLGVHESQSRLWENVVGRSRTFWQFYYPRLQDYFPEQLKTVSQESFYRAINKVEPSLIRVEADEVTYNLHIFLRFELEQDIINRRLKIADLPEAWNAKMEEYLGIKPPDEALGVLQDIHWAGGAIGYFPTYALGNVISLQFYSQALKDIPDLPEQYSRGEFGQLLDWFRQHVHRHGRKFTATELIERVTGAKSIEAEPYLTYIQQKYSEIYRL